MAENPAEVNLGGVLGRSMAGPLDEATSHQIWLREDWVKGGKLGPLH